MNYQRPTIRMASLALLVMGALSFPPVLRAANEEDSRQVSKMLSQARAQAFRLSEDTSEMESFVQADISWRGHVDAVDRIRDDVNLMGRQLARLVEARSTASPWQRTAVDRMTPLLKELASNTSAVIADLNESPHRLQADDYKEYLEANSDEAAQLASLIADFVDYGKARHKLERLANRLELR